MAINPGEEAKMQMFIWNNIFFSLGFDVKDHYKVIIVKTVIFLRRFLELATPNLK